MCNLTEKTEQLMALSQFQRHQLQSLAKTFLKEVNAILPLPTGVAKPIARQMRFAGLPDKVVNELKQMIQFSEDLLCGEGCLDELPFHKKIHWTGPIHTHQRSGGNDK